MRKTTNPLTGLKNVATTHHMGAKRPTSKTTHGRNDPVPGVSMDRLLLIFGRLVINTVKGKLLRKSTNSHDVHCVFPQSPSYK